MTRPGARTPTKGAMRLLTCGQAKMSILMIRQRRSTADVRVARPGGNSMINPWLLACVGLLGLAEGSACSTEPVTAAGRAPTSARCPVDTQIKLATPAGKERKDRAAVLRESVQAVGIGYPQRHLKGARARLMARRAAEVVAVRNLARKLGYPRRAAIRGFRYVSAEYLDDGSVRVTAEYPLRAYCAPSTVKKPAPSPGRRFPRRTVIDPVTVGSCGSVRANE